MVVFIVVFQSVSVDLSHFIVDRFVLEEMVRRLIVLVPKQLIFQQDAFAEFQFKNDGFD